MNNIVTLEQRKTLKSRQATEIVDLNYGITSSPKIDDQASRQQASEPQQAGL